MSSSHPFLSDDLYQFTLNIATHPNVVIGNWEEVAMTQRRRDLVLDTAADLLAQAGAEAINRNKRLRRMVEIEISVNLKM